jgi:hypothetical protein
MWHDVTALEWTLFWLRRMEHARRGTNGVKAARHVDVHFITS